MAHVAFFPPAAAGHINPTLGMVEELTARGHRVTYATTAEYAPRAAEAGAEVVPFKTSVAPPPDKPFELSGTDLSRGLMANLHEAEDLTPKLMKFYRHNRPDLVVFDGLAGWWGRLLAQQLDVPSMPCWTTFVSNETWNLAKTYIRPNQLDPRLWWFAARVLRLARRHGLTMTELIDGVGRGVAGHLVFMPRSFQFAEHSFGEEFHFVGPCIGRRKTQGEWTPPESGRPVLLVSLGTIYTAQPSFFIDVVRAFRDSRWHTVIALSDRVDRRLLGELPDHIEVHAQVPQLAILPHADLFINHAGITSVMEAVHHEVPMLACPQMVEQRATADRMEAVDIGRQILPTDVTAARLRTLAEGLVVDPTIRAGLSRFHADLDSAGGTTAAVDILEAAIADPGTVPATPRPPKVVTGA